MKRDPVKMVLLFYLLASIGLLLLVILFSSCKTAKDITKLSQSQLKTDSITAGTVSKSTIESETEFEWWRAALPVLAGKDKGDTIINNYTFPSPTPQYIYLEGGKGRNETKTSTYDSSWYHAFQQLLLAMEASNKKKETQVLDFWQIAALILGGVIVLKLLLSQRII